MRIGGLYRDEFAGSQFFVAGIFRILQSRFDVFAVVENILKRNFHIIFHCAGHGTGPDVPVNVIRQNGNAGNAENVAVIRQALLCRENRIGQDKFLLQLP